MATLRIKRIGESCLRRKSTPLTIKDLKSGKLQTFLDKMTQTCLKYDGVGIAAPQVGKNLRVIIVHVDPKNPRYLNRKPFPLSIIINPVINQISKQTKEDWEGDLSSNLRGLVARAISCSVSGLDRQGKKVTYELLDDFHARVFQHEIDHLDGIMFMDKVERKWSFCEYKIWRKYWKDKPISELIKLNNYEK